MSYVRVPAGLILAFTMAACQRPASQGQDAAQARADTTPAASAARPDAAPDDTATRDTATHAQGIGATGTTAGKPSARPDTIRPAPARDSSAPARSTTPRGTSTSGTTRVKRDSAKARVPDSATTQASSDTAAGSTTTASADQPLRDPYHTAPLDTVDAKTYQGWKYFNLNCSRCHGEDVQGTTIAPHLIMSLKPNGPIPDEATFQTTVCGGRVPKGMPAWCSLGMTPATIDTIYSYVKGRSDAKLHPGRPARKNE